ncbi:MAG: corrinoid protein [Candidatus Bipolaricaulia bacterium]
MSIDKTLLNQLQQAVLVGDEETVQQLTETALEGGVAPGDLLDQALISAMDQVGEEFSCGQRYIPEMLISAEAMKAAMEILKPKLIESQVKAKGKVVMGTVEGDLHDIGQSLVSMMLEGAGFEIHTLGTETLADRFVTAVREHEADLVGMSALLTTTMTNMPKVIEAFEAAGLRDRVKIMIGGAPVTQEYADKIGADGFAPDAASAVKLAERLLEMK